MTQTLSARPTAAPACRPAAPRGLTAGAVVAGPLFLGAGVVQGLTRDGFDFTRHALSQLALGGPGWIQTLNFLLTGSLLLAGAAGLHATEPTEPTEPTEETGPTGLAGPSGLTGLTGLSGSAGRAGSAGPTGPAGSAGSRGRS
ncbi:DUF998 domain-containing protein [Streptomyces kanasensis]|uniref:DUF998 domain-containing protein n=1 Tax=Streptomyces kanasensis TaxID=936756 RepID=UPI0036F81992